MPDADHVTIAEDAPDAFDDIREFLTGVRSEPDPDRVLATVMFTDIAGSTERAAEVGDARWKEVLDRHDDIMRTQLHASAGER